MTSPEQSNPPGDAPPQTYGVPSSFRASRTARSPSGSRTGRGGGVNVTGLSRRNPLSGVTASAPAVFPESPSNAAQAITGMARRARIGTGEAARDGVERDGR